MFRSSIAKQKKLRKRLIWLFQRDSIEGQLDYLVRSALRASNSFSDSNQEVK